MPYYNFIARYPKDNTVVLLEMSDVKDNYEIVNFHLIRDRGRRGKEKKGKKIA